MNNMNMSTENTQQKIFEISYGCNPRVAGQSYHCSGQAWISECEQTGIRYVTPMPNFKQIQACYEKAGTDVWPENFNDSLRRSYPLMVSLIESNLTKKTGSVCDIGCYTGGFLKTFGQTWSRYGVEPCIEAARQAEQSGIMIIGTDWTQALVRQRFDCISLLNVIEHVREQDRLIKTIVEALSPAGLLFVETGDYESIWARFMGSYWYYYSLPEHVAFHSHHSLRCLLERHGLEVVAAMTNLTHKTVAGTGLIGHMSACKRIATAVVKRVQGVTEPFRALWHDHQWILARKMGIMHANKK